MPFEFSDHVSHSGMRYLRIDASGVVERADSEAMIQQMRRPDQRRGKVLSVVQKGTQYTPEARKLFREINEDFSSVAAVVTSPILRAVINVTIRLMLRPDKNAGTARMFNDEASALDWLEAQPLPDQRENSKA